MIGVLARLLACAAPAFYTPGPSRLAEADLVPPAQIGPDWQVTPEIALHHFAVGAGKPAVFVHGGPGIPPAGAYEGLTRVPGLAVHYYDQRGCGRSTHPIERLDRGWYANAVALNAALGMEQQLADLERIRRILGVERLTLVGHSYGGFLAALYAVAYPTRVERLVLVSPADLLRLPSPPDRGMDALRSRLDPAEAAKFDDFLRRYFDYGRIFDQDEAGLAALNAEYASFYGLALGRGGVELDPSQEGTDGIGGWMVHALYLSLGRRYDLRDVIGQISVPVLVVHGERDVMDRAVTEEYAELVQNGRLVVIPGASHFAFVEQPDAFAAAVGAFLTGR